MTDVPSPISLERGEADLVRRELRLASGQSVALTQRECDVLRYLSQRPGVLVTRDELHTQVWGHAPSVLSRAADTTISRLRSKIEADTRRPCHLITVRGEGVRFVPLAQEAADEPPVALADVPLSVLRLGGTRLDLSRGVASVGSRSVALTGTECAVVQALADQAGRSVERRELVRRVWGPGGTDKALSNALARFRKKLAELDDTCEWLRVHRGQGISLVPPKIATAAAVSPRRPLLGREVELNRLADALVSNSVVTLTGPGGIGKTVLARAYAATVSLDIPRFFVDLTAVRDGPGVALALASAFGIRPRGSDPVRFIQDVIAIRGPLLLILDNFEQIDATGIDALHRWTATAPELRLLVTSRVPLGVVGETQIRIGPLSEAVAIELFHLRALEVAPAFDEQAHGDATAHLVRQLECHPLSLELAAARTRTLSPGQISTRLAEPLALLRNPAGETERHASLHRALEWSWSLLSSFEQRAWAQATTFVGSFSVDDAEAVLDLGPGAPNVWEVLERLVDFSVLQPVVLPGSTGIRLPVTVRAFGSARLKEQDPGEAAVDRHHRWVLDRFARESPYVSGPRSALRAREEVRFLDEIYSALERSIAGGQSDEALRLVYGGWAVGRGVADLFPLILPLEQICALPNVSEPTRIRALCALSSLLHEKRNFDKAAATAHEAARLAQAHGGELLAEAAVAMARVQSAQDSESAVGWIQTALEQWNHSEPFADRRVQRLLAVAQIYRGDTRAAEEACQRAITGFRRYGEALELTQALVDRGSLLLQNGWLNQARRAFEEAVAEQAAWPGQAGSIATHGNLGATYQQLKDYPRAERQYRKVIQICHHFGIPHAAMPTYASLGTLYADIGRADDSRRAYEMALGAVQGTGNARIHGFTLAMLADLDRKEGALSRAAQGLDRAEQLTKGRFRHVEVVILSVRGNLLIDDGRAEQARECHRRAERLLAEAGVHHRSRFAEMVEELGTRLAQPG